MFIIDYAPLLRMNETCSSQQEKGNDQLSIWMTVKTDI